MHANIFSVSVLFVAGIYSLPDEVVTAPFVGVPTSKASFEALLTAVASALKQKVSNTAYEAKCHVTEGYQHEYVEQVLCAWV